MSSTRQLLIKRLSISIIMFSLLCGFGFSQNKKHINESEEAERLVSIFDFVIASTDLESYSYDRFLEEWKLHGGLIKPDSFEPEQGRKGFYYKLQLPIDSSLSWSGTCYIMTTPDVWQASQRDSTIRKVDYWVLLSNGDSTFNIHITAWRAEENMVYGDISFLFFTTPYSCRILRSLLNEFADVVISTQPDIGISSCFKVDSTGAGSPEENWGKINGKKFVRYTFFAEPDTNGNRGFYELSGENWVTRHYLKVPVYIDFSYLMAEVASKAIDRIFDDIINALQKVFEIIDKELKKKE